MVDTIIIGGGLSGLALGTLLSKNNKSVILFESHAYPFHRVCGEYVSLESWPFLERLDVPLSSFNLPIIKNFSLSAESGIRGDFRLPLGGFGISRYLLDHTLANSAITSGVQLKQNDKVSQIFFNEDTFTVHSTSGTYHSKVVIGAFGKRSNLDKLLNRKFFITPDENLSGFSGIKYHMESDFPDNRIELHAFNGGYCGISRIENGLTCMCYLIESRHIQAFNGDMSEMEENILYKNPFLARYFKSYKKIWQEPKAISRINFEKKSIIENHILMIGDAGGLIAPLSGNGMSIALRGAWLASPLITEFLNGKITRSQMETRFTQLWKKNFTNRLRNGRWLQHVFLHGDVQEFAIKWLRQSPWLADLVIRQTHGNPF